MNNIWHNISKSRISEDDFISVIEISQGSKIKQELDKETGMLIVDRILHTSVQYPANYGFIPKTLSEDKDPCDVWVFCSQPLKELSMIRCFPIGIVDMIDGGMQDEKIIAVPFNDPLYRNFNSLELFPKHVFDELIHFLKVYKELEHKKIEIKGIYGKEEAKKAIKEGIIRYKKKFG